MHIICRLPTRRPVLWRTGTDIRLGSIRLFRDGLPASGESDVGQLVDISFTHMLNKSLSWRFYYGHAFGGGVVKNIYQGKKDIEIVYLDFNLVF